MDEGNPPVNDEVGQSGAGDAESAEAEATTEATTDVSNKTQIRAGAIVAIALLAAFLVWLLFVRGGSSDTTPDPARGAAALVSLDALKSFASTEGQTVYWVGPQDDTVYELTKTTNGQVYVRYLPSGEEAGSTDAFLTVGTYSIANAFAATSASAEKSSSVKVPVKGGGIAFYNESIPTSVYLSYPDSDYQIEVYDPDPARAREFVSTGQVTPVSGSTQSTSSGNGPKAVSPAGLATLGESLDYPIYWIGRSPGTKYEFTETTGGIYLRYLPAGTPVGTKSAFLTIGSYPLDDAFTITKEKSNAAGAVKVATKNGGVAFYSKSRPTSVYVAFPNVDVQIEVYDPSPAKARTIVKSGRLKPVE